MQGPGGDCQEVVNSPSVLLKQASRNRVRKASRPQTPALSAATHTSSSTCFRVLGNWYHWVTPVGVGSASCYM
eukprot:4938434-Pyramimonas_sp.AAC.1